MLFYDEDKEISNDDVFCKEHYQLPTYRIVDAIEAHKTTHQPMMLDALHMPLKMSIEMDMNGEKVVKKVSDFRRLVKLNHTFDHGQERSILFFGKDQVRSFYWSEKFSDYCRRRFFNARRIFPLARNGFSKKNALLSFLGTATLQRSPRGWRHRGRRQRTHSSRSQRKRQARRLRIHCGARGHHDGIVTATRSAEAKISIAKGANGRHRSKSIDSIVYRWHFNRRQKRWFPENFWFG